jgi:5,10-methylene-tetrahydrofolate dehydrogenase/methenyl tetrahydrofolate cyclohydrolase
MATIIDGKATAASVISTVKTDAAQLEGRAGVGPMTIAMLMSNTLLVASFHAGEMQELA